MSGSDVDTILLEVSEALNAEYDRVREELHALPHWEDALDGIAHEEWPTEPWVAAHLDGQATALKKAVAIVLKTLDAYYDVRRAIER